jgi:hypothetical protein
MVQSEKYRLVFYNNSSGTEFTLNVRGAEKYALATTFLDRLLGTVSASEPGTAHYVLDDKQLAEFRAFMKPLVQE